SKDVAQSLNNLAWIMLQTHDAEARPLLEQAMAMQKRVGASDADVARTLGNLAAAQEQAGNLEAAIQLDKQAIGLLSKSVGRSHPDVARVLNNQAMTLMAMRRFTDAEPIFREAIEIRRTVFGPEHPEVCEGLSNLALSLHEQKKFADAEAVYRQAVEVADKVLADPDAQSLMLNNFALLLTEQRKFDEAATIQRRLVESHRKQTDTHPERLVLALRNLADTLRSAGNRREAEQFYRECLQTNRQLRAGERLTADASASLAQLLSDESRFAEAQSLLETTLEIRVRLLPPGHWQIANARSLLGQSLASQKKFEQAEPLLLAGYNELTDPAQVRRRQAALKRIIDLYEAWGRPRDAEVWRAKPPTTQPQG
ncbi:MAG: tetratricopeptide repeat protein, partial [Tepidisphaeraceae bacterium]